MSLFHRLWLQLSRLRMVLFAVVPQVTNVPSNRSTILSKLHRWVQVGALNTWVLNICQTIHMLATKFHISLQSVASFSIFPSSLKYSPTHLLAQFKPNSIALLISVSFHRFSFTVSASYAPKGVVFIFLFLVHMHILARLKNFLSLDHHVSLFHSLLLISGAWVGWQHRRVRQRVKEMKKLPIMFLLWVLLSIFLCNSVVVINSSCSRFTAHYISSSACWQQKVVCQHEIWTS